MPCTLWLTPCPNQKIQHRYCFGRVSVLRVHYGERARQIPPMCLVFFVFGESTVAYPPNAMENGMQMPSFVIVVSE